MRFDGVEDTGVLPEIPPAEPGVLLDVRGPGPDDRLRRGVGTANIATGPMIGTKFRVAASTPSPAIVSHRKRPTPTTAAIVALNGIQHRGGPLIVGWANSEHAGGVEPPPVFESMNVPADGEGRESPGAPHRARLPMQP